MNRKSAVQTIRLLKDCAWLGVIFPCCVTVPAFAAEHASAVGHHAPITHIWGLASGNGRFVVAGSPALVSEDGANWRTTIHPVDRTTLALLHVSFGKHQFLADSGDELLSSKDGIEWSVVGPGPGAVTKLIFAGDWWFGLGSQGEVARSADGRDWSVRRVKPALTLHELVAFSNRYILSGWGNGGHFVSVDGDKWQMQLVQQHNNRTYAMASSASRLILAGDQALEWSDDGKVWHLPKSSTPTGGFHAVHWDGEKFIAVGENATVALSADGEEWTLYPQEEWTCFMLDNVTRLGQRYVAAGIHMGEIKGKNCEKNAVRGLILYSDDGKHWSSVTSYRDVEATE